MIVTIQFKDINKNFRGRTYDYELCDGEETPKVNDIIRMMDKDYNFICNGTRVKVVDVKAKSKVPQLVSIHYLEDSLDY